MHACLCVSVRATVQLVWKSEDNLHQAGLRVETWVTSMTTSTLTCSDIFAGPLCLSGLWTRMLKTAGFIAG